MRNAKLAGLALCAGVLMALTGCMTTPGNYENVGSVDEDVAFNGWIQQPSRWVKFRLEYRALGTGKTSGGPSLAHTLTAIRARPGTTGKRTSQSP